MPSKNAAPTGPALVEAPKLEPGDLIPDRALATGDRDEFDYEVIAARIADLCCATEAPVNIALFSPWGSGKSSLFTLIESSLEHREEAVKLIRYDAWRYGGEALPRNFIAHAARELHLPLQDPRYAEFHRGLYENKRRVSLSPPHFWAAVRNARFLPFILLALGLGVIAWLLSANSVLIGALVSVFLLILTAVVDSGKVQIEQSKPSEDEEFSRRFERLVEWATDRDRAELGARVRLGRLRSRWLGELAHNLGLYRLRLWWSPPIQAIRLEPPVVQRLVFFIDELDRCEAKDIVLTLKALRTFLDADKCIFIVAADRQAIEEALGAVEQSTPIDPERTYYSTAGAYLDKIFQHQISLPPLHSRSLAKFARSLTASAGGIWRELVEDDPGADGATPLLDLVLFTLIPSHVRSPRRVKVLLNNYATNVRMVRSRLPDAWPGRAREIARLTTFQTEFPDFAAALETEPRLPRFILDRANAPASDALNQILERWNLDASESDADVENPDPMFAGSEGNPDAVAKHQPHLNAKRRRVEKRRREELRRYLERTADVDDLRRDLFYLQPAGLDVGLLDHPELAELIEVEATDRPETVIDALDGQDREVLAGAARLLASMVEDVLGPEQKQVMTALMEVVALLGSDAIAVSREVAGALQTYWSGHGELEERHLIGALRAALTVRGESGELFHRVFSDERLWEDPGRVTAVVPMSRGLADGFELGRLRGAIARHMPESHTELLAAIGRLDQDQKLRLMDSDVIFAGITKALEVAEEGLSAGEDNA
jgi:hypothetical protein